MRILVDVLHTKEAQPSGVGVYTRSLLEALWKVNTGDEYILLTSCVDKTVPKWMNNPCVQVHHVALPNKLLNLSLTTFARPYLNRLVGEVDLAFFPNLAFASVNSSCPTVVTVHDLSWKLFPQFYSPKRRLWHDLINPENLILKSRGIIVPSTSASEDLTRTWPSMRGRVQTIPHGVDPRFCVHPEAQDHGIRSRLRLPPRYALYVGTVEKRKNIETALDALRQYQEKTGDQLPFLIAGSLGYGAKDVMRHAKEKTPGLSVRFLNYIRPEDQPALYRGAEIFLWPSIYEGFGLPVLEAMASGIPVISSLTSAMPEVAGNAAILVDPFHSGDMASALMELRRSPTLRGHFKQKGLERAKQFSWEQTARRTQEVFKAICA